MPQPKQKLLELINQKYKSPILVFGSYKSKMVTIIDTENGTLFHLSADSSYAFRDQNHNYWHTVQKCFAFEDKVYYPVLGDQYILNKKMTLSFVTQEEITAIVALYFEQFLEV